MPRRRRRDPPDNRLDWRDPDMPCLGYFPGIPMSPDDVQRSAHSIMLISSKPPWHADPLYFAAERKRSRRTPT